MFEYLARVIQIIDGDTLKLDIDMGFRCHIFETVRLARIDTPETVNYGATGISDPAKVFVSSKLPPGSFCVALITRQEKYGRWLADIYYLPGESAAVEIMRSPHVLNDELVQQGYAKRYDGGKK